MFFPCNPTVVDPSWGLGHGPKRTQFNKVAVILRRGVLKGLIGGMALGVILPYWCRLKSTLGN